MQFKQVYRLCDTDAAVSGERGKDRILLKIGSFHGGVASLLLHISAKLRRLDSSGPPMVQLVA